MYCPSLRRYISIHMVSLLKRQPSTNVALCLSSSTSNPSLCRSLPVASVFPSHRPITTTTHLQKFNKKAFEEAKALKDEAAKRAYERKLITVYMFDGTKKLQYGNLTAMEAKSVESWARHQHYTLEGIESAMSPPIMIICTRHDSIKEHVHVKELKKMLKPPPSKTFKMKGKIGDNDLKIKCQHMVELLEKSSEIHVEIARRKYDEENVLSKLHDNILSYVKEAVDDVILSSSSVTEFSCKFTLHRPIVHKDNFECEQLAPEQLLTLVGL